MFCIFPSFEETAEVTTYLFLFSASIEIRYLLKSVLERTNLNVHYVIQKKNMNLKVKTLVLHGDEEDAQMLHSDIEHILKGIYLNNSFIESKLKYVLAV